MVDGHKHISPVEKAYKRPGKQTEQSNQEQYTKQIHPGPHPGPQKMSISHHKVISFIVSGIICAGMLSYYYLFI